MESFFQLVLFIIRFHSVDVHLPPPVNNVKQLAKNDRNTSKVRQDWIPSDLETSNNCMILVVLDHEDDRIYY